MVKRETRIQARQLRSKGHSTSEIAAMVGASKSSVSVWVRDVELTEEQKMILRQKQPRWTAQNNGAQGNREKAKQQREIFQQEGREKAQQGSSLHLAGCMLYWAEGAKGRNHLHFANSDPNMQQLFVRFLREEFLISDEDIKLQIHCHSEDESIHQRCREFWSQLLDLPESNVNKIQVKKGSETRKNRLEYGICAIRVYNTQIVQHIYGAIQVYGGFVNPDWLG